jgi:phosphoribosylglycinamide formyltransferase-1
MNLNLNLVVLISGNGSNLQAIIDWIEEGKISGQIKAVISNNADAFGLQRATKANIPTLTLSHKDFSSREEYDAALEKTIEQYQPDLVILAGFMRILSAKLVSHYSGKMLNIHPSLLPKYKGLNTHQRAIDAEELRHGASVHFVTPELDDGPVVLQKSVSVLKEDTAESLARKVQLQERHIYPLAVQWFCEKRLYMKNNQAWLDNQRLGLNGYENS